MRFRTPNRCHNGHFRWLYWEVIAATIVSQRWGEASCKCPTHEIGEGFAPIGTDQPCAEIKDRRGQLIYVGDIVQRYPLYKYPHAWEIRLTSDEGFGFPDDITSDIEIVGNVYENKSQEPSR